jgi:hypothetical protein
MLKNFIPLWKAIKSVIISSESKSFKNKNSILTEIELKYLNNILSILSIFIKAITKL